MTRRILTFVLAGGRGERLDPLTRDRAKPAVPFGGIYRIIDYTLSNCVNSGLRRIYVLTQYKSFSLQKHLFAGWGNIVSNQLGEFIDVIPAQQRIDASWYRGTADAIYQNMYAIEDCDPQMVLILAGDHVYRMDYRKMLEMHQKNEADVTVACIPMPKEAAASFGVIQADRNNRVVGFQEKPEVPFTIPRQPDHILASMGIYLFSRKVLVEELAADAHADSVHDFGKNILPQMVKKRKKVCVYNFVDENNRPAYWRDIGTRDGYYQANMDLVSADSPFDLYNSEWPVRTYHEQYPPIKMVSAASGPGAIVNSLIAGGCVIEGGSVIHSVLSPRVHVKDRAEVSSSVIMDGVIIGEGARVQNAIIDKEVIIPPGATIGYDIERDKKQFFLTSLGVVIVPKRTVVTF